MRRSQASAPRIWHGLASYSRGHDGPSSGPQSRGPHSIGSAVPTEASASRGDPMSQCRNPLESCRRNNLPNSGVRDPLGSPAPGSQGARPRRAVGPSEGAQRSDSVNHSMDRPQNGEVFLRQDTGLGSPPLVTKYRRRARYSLLSLNAPLARQPPVATSR